MLTTYTIEILRQIFTTTYCSFYIASKSVLGAVLITDIDPTPK